MTKALFEEWGLDFDKFQNGVYAGDITIYKNKTQKNLLFFKELCINKIQGSLCFSFSKITSLEGCPEITDSFDCSNNKLTSLKYCPEIINENFSCNNNHLTSLKYGPKEVGKDFECTGNQLTSLKYCAKIIGRNLDCASNQLTTLKACPLEINGNFDCSDNELISLLYLPRIKNSLYCQHNLLKSISECNGKVTRIYCNNNFIEKLGPIENLEFLVCENNNIKSLPDNFYINLERFHCDPNLKRTKNYRLLKTIQNIN